MSQSAGLGLPCHEALGPLTFRGAHHGSWSQGDLPGSTVFQIQTSQPTQGHRHRLTLPTCAAQSFLRMLSHTGKKVIKEISSPLSLWTCQPELAALSQERDETT